MYHFPQILDVNIINLVFYQTQVFAILMGLLDIPDLVHLMLYIVTLTLLGGRDFDRGCGDESTKALFGLRLLARLNWKL